MAKVGSPEDRYETSVSGAECALIGRINEFEAAESAKIFVKGAQRRAVFEGECSQCGVGHERPCDLGFTYLILKKFPEPLTCSDHADIDLM